MARRLGRGIVKRDVEEESGNEAGATVKWGRRRE
jgi:hypothetical protein